MPLIRASWAATAAGERPTFLQSSVELPSCFRLLSAFLTPPHVAVIHGRERCFVVRIHLALVAEKRPDNIHLRTIGTGCFADFCGCLEALALPFEAALDTPR